MKNNIAKMLDEKKTSISELSRATSISRTTITDLTKGRKTNLSFEKARKISAFFNCAVVDIFPELSENA